VNLRLARRERATSERSGAILLLFALLTFVFFAIAGLVIDVGLANLAQAQMQVAVDSAALEGCRWRNFDEGMGDSNTEKRRKASAMARLVFDDDLHPTLGGYTPENATGPYPMDDVDSANLTAGPVLKVSDGTGAWNSNAVVGSHEGSSLAQLDDPRLQVNNLNRPHGDMVAGRFDASAPHTESGSYVRPDFVAGGPGLPNYSSLSFLVRMRRAGDADALDVQPGTSSSLPTVPIVLGLGSTILQAPGDDWDPRRDGITVRATAIASARPAMRVGRAPCDGTGAPLYDHEPTVTGPYRERIAGVVPFYIRLDRWVNHFRTAAWQANSDNVQAQVRVEPNGSLVLVSDSSVVGHFIFDAASEPANPCDYEVGWPVSVGYAVPSATASPGRPFRFTRRKPAYIPIVEEIPTSNGAIVLRVVGYAFAHLWPVGYDPNGPLPPPNLYSGTGTFVISGGELINHVAVNCWVAQDNASASLGSAADESLGPPLTATEWQAVLRYSNEFAYGVAAPLPQNVHDYTQIQRGTVLAPALTR